MITTHILQAYLDVGVGFGTHDDWLEAILCGCSRIAMPLLLMSTARLIGAMTQKLREYGSVGVWLLFRSPMLF